MHSIVVRTRRGRRRGDDKMRPLVLQKLARKVQRGAFWEGYLRGREFRIGDARKGAVVGQRSVLTLAEQVAMGQASVAQVTKDCVSVSKFVSKAFGADFLGLGPTRRRGGLTLTGGMPFTGAGGGLGRCGFYSSQEGPSDV